MDSENNNKPFMNFLKDEIGDKSESAFYKFFEESLNHLDIRWAQRSNNAQFHFDCTRRSKRNLFSVMFCCMGVDERTKTWDEITQKLKNEELREAGFANPVKQIEDDSFLFKLSKILKEVDLEITSHDDDFLCILLKSNHEASCVGTLMHRANQGDFNYIEGLNEYTTNLEVDKVRRFFHRNADNLGKFIIEIGPNLVLVSKKLRLFR